MESYQSQGWATPIINRFGNITHAIAAFQDITPRKNAERRLAAHSAVSSILAEAKMLGSGENRNSKGNLRKH